MDIRCPTIVVEFVAFLKRALCCFLVLYFPIAAISLIRLIKCSINLIAQMKDFIIVAIVASDCF